MIATRFRRRAADAGRTIKVTAPPGLVALADRRRLEQALNNLVENALRHGSGIVQLRAVEGREGLELLVTDQGQGFPLRFLEHAFDRFSRADGARAGAGLGLAIVAAIAHAHGGTAIASNQPRGGAAVGFTVPVGAEA
jgi:two-component system OmpR family sensor kinase